MKKFETSLVFIYGSCILNWRVLVLSDVKKRLLDSCVKQLKTWEQRLWVTKPKWHTKEIWWNSCCRRTILQCEIKHICAKYQNYHCKITKNMKSLLQENFWWYRTLCAIVLQNITKNACKTVANWKSRTKYQNHLQKNVVKLVLQHKQIYIIKSSKLALWSVHVTMIKNFL